MTQVHRPIIFSDAGMVVSGHHRASEAGARVLRAGGNAMDAAVAASASLCVALPHMNGLGGDCFALYYDARSRSVTAINGSGAAPAAATAERFRALGHATIPPRGPLPISTCGLVHAWQAALERFGSGQRLLGDLLDDAIQLADAGTVVDLYLQDYLDSDDYGARAAASPDLAEIFGPRGRRPLGARIRQRALSNTLRHIAADGAGALYGGEVGRALTGDLERRGALLTLADLDAHRTTFAASLEVGFLGRRLHVAPPNSQGIALALLAGLWDRSDTVQRHMPLSPQRYQRIKRIAFDCRDRLAVDPARGVPLPATLLDPAGLDALLAEAGSGHTEARRGGGDTSTLVVMDRWGNAVSWVQSLFEDFGSGVVSPSTGIVMHNRLYLESLDEASAHRLTPGVRPFHTLCPALLTDADVSACEMAIATPGDHGQPQSIFQVLLNVYEADMNIQAAVEAPRMRHDAGAEIWLESRLPDEWQVDASAAGLTPVSVGPWSRLLGGVNAIHRPPGGLMMSGADPRRSCYAIGV